MSHRTCLTAVNGDNQEKGGVRFGLVKAHNQQALVVLGLVAPLTPSLSGPQVESVERGASGQRF
jgi:hypothetical protein